MRAWIFCAAKVSAEEAIFCRRLKFGKDDMIRCADGGNNTAAAIGVTPNIVIGDMDSVKGTLPPTVRRAVHPRNKDKTDLDLCIDYALGIGCTEIILLCANGGRIDHSLAALISLRRITEAGAEGMLLTKRGKVFMIRGKTSVKRGEYSKISLIPVTDTVKGVTTEGLQYALENATLRQTDNLGVSNAFSTVEASVDVKEGILCIVCETE
ncbi:MAG: thiamine diphosphokinase [Clostridiales bacterium]|jgi:thiamine pyrophosphokinase|nr:thiamine diphosphokinase [Clostridiales bacterium]